MKRKWKQWTAFLCLLMLLAASLHLARAESAPAQEECAPYRIVLTAPGGWNRSNSAVITVNVKDEQNLGWYQMAYRMNDGDWTDCEQLFDKSKAKSRCMRTACLPSASPTHTGIRLKKAPASLSLTEAHRP